MSNPIHTLRILFVALEDLGTDVQLHSEGSARVAQLELATVEAILGLSSYNPSARIQPYEIDYPPRQSVPTLVTSKMPSVLDVTLSEMSMSCSRIDFFDFRQLLVAEHCVRRHDVGEVSV
jgi:hypothetical protein